MVSLSLAKQPDYNEKIWKSLLSDDNVTANDMNMSPCVKTKLISVPCFIASKNKNQFEEGKTHNPLSVICAAFSDGFGLLALSTGDLLRWCCRKKRFFPIRPPVLSPEPFTAQTLFLSPGGHHGLITFTTGDVLYVSSEGLNCFPLASLKGFEITCVGWDVSSPPTAVTTYEILLGTQQGTLYSTSITNKKESLPHLLLCFPLCSSLKAITIFRAVGCENKKNVSSSETRKVGVPDNKPKLSEQDYGIIKPIFCILIATSKKLYKFSGGPGYRDIFHNIVPDKFLSDTSPGDRDMGLLSKMTLRKTNEDSLSRLNVRRFQSTRNGAATYDTPYLRDRHQTCLELEDCLIYESPKDTHLTTVLLSCPFDLYGKQQSPSHPVVDAVTQQMRTVTPLKEADLESFLVWWLTGAGVLVFWIFPPKHGKTLPDECLYDVDHPQTAGSTTAHPESSALFHYDVSLQPFLYSFPRFINESKESFKKKGGPGFLRAQGTPKFQLWEKRKYYETEYFMDNIPLPHHENEPAECLGIALTDYHLFMLFSTHLAVVSRIINTQVQCISLPAVRYGVPCCLLSDQETGMIFLLTTRYIFQLYPTRESECVWIQRLASQKIEFPFPCSSLSPSISRFLCCQNAKQLFSSGNLQRGTDVLMNCPVLLEDLLLHFYISGATHSDIAQLIRLICMRLEKKYPSLRNPETFFRKGTSSELRWSMNPEFFSTLQLWEIMELVHAINDAEFEIERLKQYRSRLGGFVKPSLHGENEHLSARRDKDQETGTSPTDSLDNSQADFHSVHQQLLALLKGKVTCRRSLLEALHHRMKIFHSHSSELENEALLSLVEHLGRQEEKVYWARLLENQEIQAVECICQNHYKEALDRLTETTQMLNGENDTSNYSHTKRFIEKREKQLYLLAKFGPLLFSKNPVEFSSNVFSLSDDESLTSDSFSSYLKKKICSDPSTADLFIPLLLGAATPLSNYCSELHQQEALKMIKTLLIWLGFRDVSSQEASNNSNSQDSKLLQSSLCNSTALHNLSNLYVTILASNNSLSVDEELVNFFSQLTASLPVSIPEQLIQGFCFNLRYCVRKNHVKSVVFQMCLLEMHENAIDIALDVGDPWLAKSVIDRIPSNSETFTLSFKKRLWKKIAHSAKNILDPPQVISLLMESNGVFQFHDMLEFFPERSLETAYRDVLFKEYDHCEQRIREKQMSIQTTQKSIEFFRCRMKQNCSEPLSELSKDKGYCFVCYRSTDSDRFYIFPCGHLLHAICAHQLIYPLMDEETKTNYWKAVDSLRQTFMIMNEFSNQDLKSLEKEVELSKKKITLNEGELHTLHSQEEAVDKFLAAECPLCGDWMLKTIEIPFLNDKNASENVEKNPSEKLVNTSNCQHLWSLEKKKV